MEFAILKHQACFERLEKFKFGQSRFPNLSAVREIQLGDDIADEIDELLSASNWWHLLSIREPVIHMLTLEVLRYSSLTGQIIVLTVLMLYSSEPLVSTIV